MLLLISGAGRSRQPMACASNTFTRHDLLHAASAIAASGCVGHASPALATSRAGDGTASLAGAIIYETASGLFLPADPQRYLSAAIEHSGSSGARVFFAGEEHSHPLHHAFQLELIKAVDAIDAAPTLIGLEMCWRQHQPALDAFVFGTDGDGGGDVDKLAERTSWGTTWGYPIELYEPILQLARARRLRLCGLNVPYQVIQEVSRVGLSSLSSELRSFLPGGCPRRTGASGRSRSRVVVRVAAAALSVVVCDTRRPLRIPPRRRRRHQR